MEIVITKVFVEKRIRDQREECEKLVSRFILLRNGSKRKEPLPFTKEEERNSELYNSALKQEAYFTSLLKNMKENNTNIAIFDACI